jgi:hypothetical protein
MNPAMVVTAAVVVDLVDRKTQRSLVNLEKTSRNPIRV